MTEAETLLPPRKLQRDDPLDGFSSGAQELDDWLVRFAYTNLRANNATTYVTTLPADGKVVGYYAISTAAVERANAPGRMQKGRPSQIPCILLARLAVHQDYQGRGIGVGLLADALRRSLLISESVGAAAVLVHARDEAAKAFYLAHGDFLESPLESLQLMAPMKRLREIFGEK